MRAHFGSRLGTGGQAAIELLVRGRSANTHRNYRSKIRLYFEFCAQTGSDPIAPDALFGVRYVHFLAERGTIHADSLQPYLSAVNSFLDDLELPRVAIGSLVALAKRGVALAQEPLSGAPRDEQPWLPASAAFDMLRVACDRLDVTLASAGPDAFERSLALSDRYAELLSLEELRDARPFLAVVFGYLCANRAGTTQAARFGDLFCAAPPAQRSSPLEKTFGICFRVSEAKGQHLASRKRVLTIPVSFECHATNALLQCWFCLRSWRAAKARLCPEFAVHSARLWELPGDPRAFGAALQSRWVAAAASADAAVGPFGGFVSTSHVLRHGAASAMAALQVAMFAIRNHGGWAQGSSTLESTYIHPECQADEFAFAFFGHLLPRRFERAATVLT
jgi:hypothetical protein